MTDEWEKEFDEEFRFRSDELARDGNYQGTELSNELKAFIHKTRQEAYHQGYKDGFENFLETDKEVDTKIQEAIAGERQRILRELPAKFWEDEDHAVGGYISKKDLYKLLTPSPTTSKEL